MNEEALTKYREARKELDASQHTVERFAAEINEGARLLKDWRRTMVSNCTAGFPAEVALVPGSSIDASRWPSGEALGTALSSYHQARHAARNAYNAIPDDLRSVVEAPPD